MSSRKEVPHPSSKKKHDKLHKRMPTMEKAGRFMNLLREQEDKRQQINSSIINRANFLHNTKINNALNEVSRLNNIRQTGMVPFGNDGRFRRLSPQDMQAAGLRATTLTNEIRNAQPIIETRGLFSFV